MGERTMSAMGASSGGQLGSDRDAPRSRSRLVRQVARGTARRRDRAERDREARGRDPPEGQDLFASPDSNNLRHRHTYARHEERGKGRLDALVISFIFRSDRDPSPNEIAAIE